MSVLATMKSTPFWLKTMLGFILGALVGITLPKLAQELIPIGDAFINAISLIVVPIVFLSIVSVITQMEDSSNLKRAAVKTILMFMFTAVIASILGLVVANFFNFSFNEPVAQVEQTFKKLPSFLNLFTEVVPKNPITALESGKILQVFFLAILIGFAMRKIGDKAKPVTNIFASSKEIVFKATNMILAFTPIGVFALMANMFATFGFAALLPLIKFVMAIYLTCLIHIFFVYLPLVKFLGNMSPIKFLKIVFPAQIFAYSSSSSYGTLPISTKCTVDGLKVSKNYASFSLPLGATMNMDGCGGIYPAIAAIFIAAFYQIPLDMFDYFIIVIIATIASIGTAGVPGTALVMLSVTLTAVGLPLEGIGIIAAIDRIIDMMRTATNITGDMAVSRVIANQENLLTDK